MSSFSVEMNTALISKSSISVHAVTGSGAQIWRISDKNETGQITVQTSSSERTNAIIGAFRLRQISQSPIISNISFTVRSNINKYRIECEDQHGGSETCIINIAGY